MVVRRGGCTPSPTPGRLTSTSGSSPWSSTNATWTPSSGTIQASRDRLAERKTNNWVGVLATSWAPALFAGQTRDEGCYCLYSPLPLFTELPRGLAFFGTPQHFANFPYRVGGRGSMVRIRRPAQLRLQLFGGGMGLWKKTSTSS